MRDIIEINNEALGEKYYKIKHPSGLNIIVYPKEGYSSSYAIFGTNYGSIDTKYKRSDKDELIEMPEGCAHFLEHKLFESEELDAFERFAKTGASANAYTSFDKTCYLFSCSDNFDESLTILLDFVRSPYFTAKTVQKEQGIIGQEIKMYKDVPDWQVLFNLLGILYEKHPVRIDIAGTVESISEITDQTLYDCYNTFYNLNNMVLVTVGNVTVDGVLKIADEQLKKCDDVVVKRASIDEPETIVKNYTEEKLSVEIPQFTLGFKETYDTPMRSLSEKIMTAVLLEVISGNTSSLYKELLDDELINDSFGNEYFTGYGYSSVIFAGESKNPEEVSRRIKEHIKKAKTDGISQEDFDRAKKMLYGRSIMQYNDVEGLANDLIACSFEGYELFDELSVFKSITKADTEERLKVQMNEEYSALSVILPA